MRDSHTFLGRVISQEGVAPDPAKVQAVQDWPTPNNLHEIRGFLGFADFYGQFVPNLAKVAAPLTDLTKATTSHCDEMTPAAKQAF